MIGKSDAGTRIALLPEVLEILQQREKDAAVGYEQQITEEYAKKLSKLSVGDARKMLKELMELGLSEKAAAKVIEVMPNEIILLKQVLIIEKRGVDEETVAKAFAVVNSYRGG
ncbi:MAG: hypothetical protein M1354_02555 [Candidatus Marsarchaeota archaeon]|jgi:DNA-directed RNA polymerase subunit F|nr:hypothetical protein [Candidatus Marsarchaeota archaeon]